MKWTFYFNDVFPTLDAWVEFTDALNVYDNSDEDAAARAFNEWVYGVLSAEFYGFNARYTTQEAFKAAFARVYMDRFRQFYKEKELIDAIYKLTPDEIRLLGETLHNRADNPNTSPNDPREPLPYVSDQTYQLLKAPRLAGYLQAIADMPSLNIDRFTRERGRNGGMSFYDLFIQVIPDGVAVYKNGGY